MSDIRRKLKEHGWIPQDEKKPRPYERVIACLKDGSVWEAVTNYEGTWKRSSGYADDLFDKMVTGWKNFPGGIAGELEEKE